jgi:hypothetical protein
VAHNMAMSWRQRALEAEEHCRRLQQKYDRLQRKQEHPLDQKVIPIDPAEHIFTWEMDQRDDVEVSISPLPA